MDLETLNEIQQEVERFKKRLMAAKKRIKEDSYATICGSKETGAVRRAALDLKMELTRITKY